MKAVLRRVIPTTARPWLRRQWNRVAHFGWKRECPVRGGHLRQFVPHGDPVELEAVCPLCGSKAPHRLACLFFERHRELFRRGETCLHVAPEPELGRRLAGWCRDAGMTYRIGGLAVPDEQKLDLCRTGLPDGSIDLLYCCHVLNVMPEDRPAIRESYRILRPGGTAVLQVPAFCTEAATLEPLTAAGRQAAFRDELIYRFYTETDFEARLKEAGFGVTVFRAASFPRLDVERWQLKRELLHVCWKPAAGRAEPSI